MTQRSLKRPPNGWDRKPNYALPDMLAFVGILWAGAMFFHWMAAVLDAIVTGI